MEKVTKLAIEKVEQYVYHIEQIMGSGDDPQIIKWKGMLDLAKGDRDAAIKKLLRTYEQFKGTGKKDPLLSYTLAKIFENSSEIGAVTEYYVSSIGKPRGIEEKKPELLANKLAEIMHLDPGKLEEMGQKGHNRIINNYTLDIASSRTFEAYSQLLSKK